MAKGIYAFSLPGALGNYSFYLQIFLFLFIKGRAEERREMNSRVCESVGMNSGHF